MKKILWTVAVLLGLSTAVLAGPMALTAIVNAGAWMGIPLKAGAPADGQVYKFAAANGDWELGNPLAGAVTNVTGTAPIASSGGATPAISLNDSGIAPGACGDAAHTGVSTYTSKGLASGCVSTSIAISTAQVTSGTFACGLEPALTGDVTSAAGSCATTLAAVGSSGSCGSASTSCALTFDTKGRETARVDTSIALAGSQITSGTIPIAVGGTNAGAIGAQGSIPYATVTAYGFSNSYTSGYVWTSGGSGAPVAVQYVPPANGGTGVGSLAGLTPGTGLIYSAGGPFTAAVAGTLGIDLTAALTWTGAEIFGGGNTVGITKTTNQLTLGAAGHVLVLSSTAPVGASWTLTLPDPTANDSVLYAALAQVISGKSIDASQLTGTVASARLVGSGNPAGAWTAEVIGAGVLSTNFIGGYTSQGERFGKITCSWGVAGGAGNLVIAVVDSGSTELCSCTQNGGCNAAAGVLGSCTCGTQSVATTKYTYQIKNTSTCAAGVLPQNIICATGMTD